MPDNKKPNDRPSKSLAERSMQELHALIGDREFSSTEELNEFLSQNFNGRRISGAPADTPEKRAQALVYDAWDTIDDAEARRLIDEALAIDPACPDALTHLATLTDDVEISRRLLEQALSSAEGRLGADFITENVGYFWSIFETRPYMRARFGLAQLLWDSGHDNSAIEHAWEILRLNPGDNLGLRDILAGWLLFKGRTSDAARLLRTFEDDDTSTMEWARALLRFQAFGRTDASDEALANALHANEAVAAYLLQLREWPDAMPETYAIGSEDESVITAYLLADAWAETHGALDWLIEFLNEGFDREDDPDWDQPRLPKLT